MPFVQVTMVSGRTAGQKHALIAAKPIDHRSSFPVQRPMIGLERDVDPAQVGDVLSHRQISVDVNARHRFIRGILCSQPFCPGLESLRIRLAPPIAKLPRRVKLSPLVVEAVGQFMANDPADRPVIDRRIRRRIELRRLKNARRKHDVTQ